MRKILVFVSIITVLMCTGCGKKCSVSRCDEKVEKNGLCSLHVLRQELKENQKEVEKLEAQIEANDKRINEIRGN